MRCSRCSIARRTPRSSRRGRASACMSRASSWTRWADAWVPRPARGVDRRSGSRCRSQASTTCECPPRWGGKRVRPERAVSHVHLFTIVVHEYDPAVAFFVDILGFELVEDEPSTTTDGRPKRWVVVRPPGAQTGILLARADGADQQAVVGRQAAGRVGFFLRVDDFEATYRRLA